MKFLFISDDLIGGHIAYRLVTEGHDVKMYIGDPDRAANFTNLVPKTDNWKEELDWIGTDGTIIFDYVGDGHTQDSLRKEGYAVFGAGSAGEALEEERVHMDELFSSLGMNTVPIHDFTNIIEAISYIKRYPARYVIKKNDIANNTVSYVGKLADGRDVIDTLINYQLHNAENCKKISLQKYIGGIEIAVARFFNGTSWVSPIEINIEHNPFMAGDLGLSTSEMGTLAWNTNNEDNQIYAQTLQKLKPHLQEINYRGVVDINCIVNESGVYPLEVTARFGSPVAHLQTEMLQGSTWGELLHACAHGIPYTAHWKSGYGIVVFLTAPPFPYAKQLAELNPRNSLIHFARGYKYCREHVHLEDVSFDPVNSQYYISDTRGYILYVTAEGETMQEAQKLVYDRCADIYFPKMTYRNDIGSKFIRSDQQLLQEWGYLEI